MNDELYLESWTEEDWQHYELTNELEEQRLIEEAELAEAEAQWQLQKLVALWKPHITDLL